MTKYCPTEKAILSGYQKFTLAQQERRESIARKILNNNLSELKKLRKLYSALKKELISDFPTEKQHEYATKLEELLKISERGRELKNETEELLGNF